MLTHLTIRNYALIRHLELTPSAHLNVITGETGAGKSIMLGAIGLLMGNRADTRVLWDENEKCIIEGSYQIKGYKLKNFFRQHELDYDDQTTIRREISPGGKSRAFINDTPVTLDVLRAIGSFLMDIHSQHETLELGNQSFQLQLVDSFAGNAALLESYGAAWSAFNAARHAYESLQAQADSLRKEYDYMAFQLDELRKAGLEGEDQETLEAELRVMEHGEEIKNRFNAALVLLSRSEQSVEGQLSEVRNQLHHLTGFSQAYQKLFERLESTRIELKDLLNEIELEEGKVEFDPARIEFVKDRLSTIYRLQKKHQLSSLSELLTLQETLQEKVRLATNLDAALLEKKGNLARASEQVKSQALHLTQARTRQAEPLAKKIVKLLRELGMPNAMLEVVCSPVEPSPTGADRIEVNFSANKGIAPRPLAQVASGGEFSRLMFCIKYVMAEKASIPTLILDEIDSGVSGEIAIRLGNLMVEMAKDHQLIAISHLPQIAAKGDTHYVVFKDNSQKKTVSSIRKLEHRERVEEIAKMIGGEKPSKVALENAEELLSR